MLGEHTLTYNQDTLSTTMDKEHSIVLFNQKQVRRHYDPQKELWFFSIVDVVAILTETTTPKRYWSDLKIKLKKEGSEVYEKIVHLKLPASDGKKYMTDCFSTEDLLRAIQSIPSPKAEPFKVWLAKVGYQRIQEIENPELATQRTKTIYKAKGYSDAWIEKRMRGIAVQEELTEEWQKRGIKDKEYGILTAEISKATFGMTPAEYQKYKNLKRENLRDHMTDLELIFSMLGEAATTEIARSKDAQGFKENKHIAREGGEVAGKAREDIERRSGNRIISKKNFLDLEEGKKLKGKN